LLTDADILKMPRSTVRYFLYRIRTWAEGGPYHDAEEIKEYYEKQKGFTCWEEFARIWDIDEEGKHNRIVRRSETEEEAWTDVLKRYMKELIPVSENG